MYGPVCREFKRPKPIYYIVDEFLPDKRFWKIPMYGEQVWVIHPDSLITFERICAAEYVRIEKFEVTDEMISAEIEKLGQQINEELIADLESTFILRRY